MSFAGRPSQDRSRFGKCVAGAAACLFTFAAFVAPVHAGVARMARSPYVGAIVVEADTGNVLFEDRADTRTYPASVTKMMTMLLSLETLERGGIKLTDRVKVTREAARTGGSQIYLTENEIITVDDLLYALMIQSANDAAVALAVHIAGSRDMFVKKMNERAKILGMKATQFGSPHGLPPAAGQKADMTTARDMSVLARELLKRKDVLRYTSARSHAIRKGRFVMRSHNRLLSSVRGCDGLKTGYFSAAGFSIAATARRDGVRVVTVVLGSDSSRVRDRKAAELMEKGFTRVLASREAAAGEPLASALDVR